MFSRESVGPQILAVLQHVARHPGCSSREAAAAAAGVSGILNDGDHAVKVCLAAGLIDAGTRRKPTGLSLTEAGQAALNPPPSRLR